MVNSLKIIRSGCLLPACLALPAALAAQTPAFPGAEGFGAEATGGRGGAVYHVVNLNDAGPGSLRAGVENNRAPRVIVFDVGGYIPLKSVLRVGSNLTLAGQTAPGEGIGLRDSEVSFAGSSNVVVRWLRIRQGLAPRQDKKSAINITGGSRMIFDHLSIQWGRWDTVDMNDSTDITFQDCIIGPGVAPQSFGCLCQCQRVSFLRNLWINNHSRNPKAKGLVQYVNNVIYDWGVCGYVGGHSAAEHAADLICNYFIKGPSSSDHFAGEFAPTDHIFQTGNFIDMDRDGRLNGRPVTPSDFAGPNAPTLVPAPAAVPRVAATVLPAERALRGIAARVGPWLHRDAVDRRLIADLESFGKLGKNIRDPQEMGGFGALEGGAAPLDSDGDGLPDFWERATGSDPKTPDANAPAGNGWTRLDEYLNWLAGPHVVTASNQAVDFNLAPLLGRLDASSIELSAAENCVAALLADGTTARITPRQDFSGRARVHFAPASAPETGETLEILVTPR